jgi:hypothetical protein
MLGSEWDKFSHLFKRQQIAAKKTLLREGQVSKTAYYIEKGCIRSWFNNHGKDITFQFFFEGEGVSSVESFRTNQPSLFNIETITTMNTPRLLYRLVFGNAVRKAVMTGTFWKMGYRNRKWISLNRVKMVSEKKRKNWLARLEKRFAALN